MLALDHRIRLRKELRRYIAYTLLGIYVTAMQQYGSHVSGSLAEGSASIHTAIDSLFGMMQCATVMLVMHHGGHAPKKEHLLRGLLGLGSAAILACVVMHISHEALERMHSRCSLVPARMALFTGCALLGNMGQLALFLRHRNQTEKTSYFHGLIDLAQNMGLLAVAFALMRNPTENIALIDAAATLVILSGIGILISYLLYRAIGILSGRIHPETDSACSHP